MIPVMEFLFTDAMMLVREGTYPSEGEGKTKIQNALRVSESKRSPGTLGIRDDRWSPTGVRRICIRLSLLTVRISETLEDVDRAPPGTGVPSHVTWFPTKAFKAVESNGLQITSKISLWQDEVIPESCRGNVASFMQTGVIFSAACSVTLNMENFFLSPSMKDLLNPPRRRSREIILRRR